MTSIMGLAWSQRREVPHLWCRGFERCLYCGVSAWTAGGSPERIEMAGANAIFPSIAPAGDRLVFARLVDDNDIYRFEAGTIRSTSRAVFSIRRQPAVLAGWPSYRLHLGASGQRGEGVGGQRGRIGTGATDTRSGPMAGFARVVARRPAIAFESQGDDGSWHIWTVDIQSGIQQQITTGQGDQNMPTWSARRRMDLFLVETGRCARLLATRHLANAGRLRVEGAGHARRRRVSSVASRSTGKPCCTNRRCAPLR